MSARNKPANRREILEHSSGLAFSNIVVASCWRMGHEHWVLLKTLRHTLHKPFFHFPKLYADLAFWRRKFPALLPLPHAPYYPLYQSLCKPVTFNGVFIYIFFAFTSFFLIILFVLLLLKLCLFTWALYLLPAICLKWQSPPNQPLNSKTGTATPSGHFHSSRARQLLRKVWKKRIKRHKVCRAFAFGIQQDKHKMKCEAEAATNFQLTKFERLSAELCLTMCYPALIK